MEYRVLCAKEDCGREKFSPDVCPVCGSMASILRINGTYEIEVGQLGQGELASLLEEFERVNGKLDNGKYLGGPTF